MSDKIFPFNRMVTATFTEKILLILYLNNLDSDNVFLNRYSVKGVNETTTSRTIVSLKISMSFKIPSILCAGYVV